MPDNNNWDFTEETPGGDDDGWGSFSGDDDWSVPTSDEDVEQDDFPSPPSSPTPQQGSFIQPDDDGWGSTSGLDEQQLSPQPDQQYQDDFADSQAQVQEFRPRQFNLSMKKVAVIILVLGVVAALIFVGLDKIHFTKKPTTQPNPGVTQQQQSGDSGASQTQTPSQNQSGSQGSTAADIDSVVLVEIPDTTQLSYDGDVLEVNGRVTSKVRYVCGHQVLYCINIGVTFGTSSENVSYYGTYSSFSNVQIGDIVILKYQQVNDSYISVVSVSK